MVDGERLTFAPDTHSLTVLTAPGFVLLAWGLYAVPWGAPVAPLSYGPAAVILLCGLAYVGYRRRAYRAIGATYAVDGETVAVAGPLVRDRSVRLRDVTAVEVTGSFSLERLFDVGLGGDNRQRAGTVTVRHDHGAPLRLAYVRDYVHGQGKIRDRAAAAGGDVDADSDDGSVPDWARA